MGRITGKEVLGIEFEKNRLKVAHLRATLQKEEVVNLIHKDTSGLSDTDIAQALLGIIDTISAKSLEVVDIINPSSVITKNIEVPSVDPKEIKEIVSLQAGRHTPYSREEIIVDYVNLGVYRKNYTRLLLVIVNRNIIKRRFDILNKAGLIPEKVIFSAEAVALNCARLLNLETENSEAGIIHIDEESTDFIIVFKNKPIFIRPIPLGAKQLVFEKQNYALRFLEEIKRSQEAYLSEDIGKLPSRFILTGGIEALGGIDKEMNIPLERVSYLRNISFSEKILKDLSLNKNISFFNTLSSLVSIEKIKIDLIPEEIKLKKALQIRAKELFKTGILVLSILVVLFFILLSKIYFKTLYLKNLDKKYQALSLEAKEVENSFSRLSLVKNYLSKRGYSLEVLAQLYDILPKEIELSNIRFEEAGKFSLRGSALSMSVVFSLVDNLEKSNYFKEVKTRYTTKRKTSTGDVTDFEIVCNLEKPS